MRGSCVSNFKDSKEDKKVSLHKRSVLGNALTFRIVDEWRSPPPSCFEGEQYNQFHSWKDNLELFILLKGSKLRMFIKSYHFSLVLPQL